MKRKVVRLGNFFFFLPLNNFFEKDTLFMVLIIKAKMLNLSHHTKGGSFRQRSYTSYKK